MCVKNMTCRGFEIRIHIYMHMVEAACLHTGDILIGVTSQRAVSIKLIALRVESILDPKNFTLETRSSVGKYKRNVTKR